MDGRPCVRHKKKAQSDNRSEIFSAYVHAVCKTLLLLALFLGWSGLLWRCLFGRRLFGRRLRWSFCWGWLCRGSLLCRRRRSAFLFRRRRGMLRWSRRCSRCRFCRGRCRSRRGYAGQRILGLASALFGRLIARSPRRRLFFGPSAPWWWRRWRRFRRRVWLQEFHDLRVRAKLAVQ